MRYGRLRRSPTWLEKTCSKNKKIRLSTAEVTSLPLAATKDLIQAHRERPTTARYNVAGPVVKRRERRERGGRRALRLQMSAQRVSGSAFFAPLRYFSCMHRPIPGFAATPQSTTI